MTLSTQFCPMVAFCITAKQKNPRQHNIIDIIDSKEFMATQRLHKNLLTLFQACRRRKQ